MHNYHLSCPKTQWKIYLLTGKKKKGKGIQHILKHSLLKQKRWDKSDYFKKESVKFRIGKQPMSTTYLASQSYPHVESWSKRWAELLRRFQRSFQSSLWPSCSLSTTVLDILHLTRYFHHRSNRTSVFQLQQEQCVERWATQTTQCRILSCCHDVASLISRRGFSDKRKNGNGTTSHASFWVQTEYSGA